VPERRAQRDDRHAQSPIVVHLHTPLAAGTTVKRLLQRWALDTRRRLVDAWEEDFLAWDATRQSQVDVLTCAPPPRPARKKTVETHLTSAWDGTPHGATTGSLHGADATKTRV
jgi:hypothetical protein